MNTSGSLCFNICYSPVLIMLDFGLGIAIAAKPRS